MKTSLFFLRCIWRPGRLGSSKLLWIFHPNPTAHTRTGLLQPLPVASRHPLLPRPADSDDTCASTLCNAERGICGPDYPRAGKRLLHLFRPRRSFPPPPLIGFLEGNQILNAPKPIRNASGHRPLHAKCTMDFDEVVCEIVGA